MKKIFVLDTNVLLQDPEAIFAFEENDVVIPAVVLEEINSKKRRDDELGRNARKVARVLDKLRASGQLHRGVELEAGGTLRIELNHKHFGNLKDYFFEASNDNRILAVALNLCQEEKQKANPKQVVMVSKDVLVRVKADALGVSAQDYLTDKIVSYGDLYAGYDVLNVHPSIIDDFYNARSLELTSEPFAAHSFYPHQFVILKDQLGTSKSALTYFNPVKNTLEPLHAHERDIWGIGPRNAQQKMAFHLLLDDSLPLVTLTGRAGTGKTLVSLAAGLYKTEELGIYKKLLVARPIVPMGKDLGYLPGDKDEKLRPWMQPIFDNLEYIFGTHREGNLEHIMLGLKRVEVEALTFIRGRTIPKQFILIDEAQNLTKHEAKTIISRVGEGSKIVMLGDPEQIDHPYLDSQDNGLTYVVEKFKEYSEAGHIRFEKGERSRLAQLAAEIL